MAEKGKYVKRESYSKAFENFLKTPNSDLDGQVMLIVADQGMGKTALLQGLAKEASDNGHVVVIGEIDAKDTDFSGQIYPLIAQLKLKKRIKFGSGGNWLKTGFTGFAIAADLIFTGGAATAAIGVSELGKLLGDIRNGHSQAGFAPRSLAEIFHTGLLEREKKIKPEERIVIFIDPEKESPSDLIPLIRRIKNMGMPEKTRFVIAQRPNDKLIEAYKKHELDSVCQKPANLSYLTESEESEFLDAYDPDGRLDNKLRSAIIKKYRGWPLLIELAVTQLLKDEDEISLEYVDNLPDDIRGFWEERYKSIHDENTLKLLHTVCMLPHPYPREKLSLMAGLNPSALATVLNYSALWDLLDTVDYDDIMSQQYWANCPYPKHASAKAFVEQQIDEDESLKNNILEQIISYYQETIGDDLSGAKVDRDSLIFLPQFLFRNNEITEYIELVARINEIKIRYGIIDSAMADLQVLLLLADKIKLKELKIFTYGNIGIVYRIRGDLDKALEMYSKALALNREMGRKEGMASDYGNMGIVYQKSGNLDKALEMYAKAQALNEEMDSKKGMASVYGNMGIVYQKSGDLDQACGYWQMSLMIFKEIGAMDRIEKVEGWIKEHCEKQKRMN